MEMRDALEHALGSELLLDAIERYFGAWEMNECFASIARDYEVEEGN